MIRPEPCPSTPRCGQPGGPGCPFGRTVSCVEVYWQQSSVVVWHVIDHYGQPVNVGYPGSDAMAPITREYAVSLGALLALQTRLTRHGADRAARATYPHPPSIVLILNVLLELFFREGGG